MRENKILKKGEKIVEKSKQTFVIFWQCNPPFSVKWIQIFSKLQNPFKDEKN